MEEQKARFGANLKLAIGTGPEYFKDRRKKEKTNDGEDEEKKVATSSMSATSSSERRCKCKLQNYC